MSWQDVLAILSFLVGLESLRRTGNIQKALTAQTEHKFQRDNARNFLPQVKDLLDQVQADYEDLDQVERDIKQVQSVLSQLQHGVDISKPHVEKILKMINENADNGYNGESLSHTSQAYIDELSALVIALKKEAD